MSTGPLGLNWISNALKARPRANEEPASAPADSPAKPSGGARGMASDNASLDAGQQRYMAFAETALPEAPPESESEAPPAAVSAGLDMEWATNTPAQGAPSSSDGGLGLEWRTGNATAGTSGQGTASASSGGNGLGVEWRSGSSSSSGLGAWGGGGTTAAPSGGGLGVEWQSGQTSSGLGAYGGNSGGSSSGGLDVDWAGGSSGGLGGLNGGSSGGLGGLNGGSSGGLGGLNGGGSAGDVPTGLGEGGATGGTGSTGGVTGGGSALDAAARQNIQGLLTAPLPPIPERPASNDWRQSDLRNRAALVVAIRQDAGLQAALANWNQLPDNLRLEAGKRISALQGAVYGYTPAGVHLDPSLQAPANGYYDPGSNQLHVSRDVLADPRNFVNTVTHEQAHAYQWEKGKAAKSGSMDASDPLYATARAWYDNYFDYQEPSYSYQAYRQQPIEAHAFATGDAVAAGVFS